MVEKDHNSSRSRSNSTISTDSDSTASRVQSRTQTRASKISTELNRTYSGSYPDDVVPYTSSTPSEEHEDTEKNTDFPEGTSRQDVDLERGPNAGQVLEKSKTGRSTLANSKLVSHFMLVYHIELS